MGDGSVIGGELGHAGSIGRTASLGARSLAACKIAGESHSEPKRACRIRQSRKAIVRVFPEWRA